MATVIGVIGSILTIFSFLQDNFADDDGSPNDSKMRIAVGLDGTEGLDNAGGDYPDVRLFNEVGDFIGSSYDPGYITDGTVYDLTITQSVGQQPTYALFTGNVDAVCIAYAAQTWPDGQKYGWVGTWGHTCGAYWYYSGFVIDGKKPDCIWLDSNGDATDVTGFQVHFSEFNDKGQGYNDDPSYYCNNAPPLNFYYSPDPSDITYWTRKRNGIFSESENINPQSQVLAPKKRGLRALDNDTRLIMSSAIEHTATELCGSATSVGPDFISLEEGKFCNMNTRIVYPLCGNTVDTCFDVEEKKLVAQDAKLPDQKEYTKIFNW